MQINKVNPGSGAQWLLDALALLKKRPGPLVAIGLLYGVLASIPFLSLLVAALGVVLAGGVLVAVREADHGNSPGLPTLFAGFSSGKVGRLLVLLLVAVVFMLAISIALALMVGGDGLQMMQRIIESTPAGGQPDPALIAQLPAGRILGWFALVLLLGVLVWIYTFFFLPLVMFGDLTARQALATGFRASLTNIGALLVYLLVSVVFSVAVVLAAVVLSSLIGMAIGATWGAIVSNLLVSAVVMPVSMAATYYAWRQVFGGVAAPASAARGLEA
jgi:hypothetical protein